MSLLLHQQDLALAKSDDEDALPFTALLVGENLKNEDNESSSTISSKEPEDSSSATITTSVTVDEDPLASFGKELNSMDFSSMWGENSSQMADGEQDKKNDLLKTIEDKKKGKSIGPLTHG